MRKLKTREWKSWGVWKVWKAKITKNVFLTVLTERIVWKQITLCLEHLYVSCQFVPYPNEYSSIRYDARQNIQAVKSSIRTALYVAKCTSEQVLGETYLELAWASRCREMRRSWRPILSGPGISTWHPQPQQYNRYKSSKPLHVTPSLWSLHWLEIKERIDWELTGRVQKFFGGSTPLTPRKSDPAQDRENWFAQMLVAKRAHQDRRTLLPYYEVSQLRG